MYRGKQPIDVALERGYPIVRRNSWHVDRTVLKFRFGNVVRWENVARELGRPLAEVGWALFSLQADLIMRRETVKSVADVERLVGRGAAALLNRHGIAHRTGDSLIFSDVAKTVGESRMRGAQARRTLPAIRSRDLLLKMSRLHLASRGGSLFLDGTEQQAITLLRSRATDKEILRRWGNALLSRIPKVNKVSGLVRHWNLFGAERG